MGYFVLLNLLVIDIYLGKHADGGQFPYVLLSQDYVVDLLIANIVFLLWRLLHRVIFTARIYDWRHGLMAVPRLVVSNFVNFIASMRAIRIYLSHIVTGKPLVWDKTAHSYPITLRRDTQLAQEGNRAIENVALNMTGRQFDTRLNKESRPPEMPMAGEREHEATHV